MANHDLREYYRIEIIKNFPPGFSMAQWNDLQIGVCIGVGKQANSQPANVTNQRPQFKTVYEYEDGEIVGVDDVANVILMAGNFSGEGWPNNAAARAGVAKAWSDCMSERAGEPVPVPPAKLIVTKLTQAEAAQADKPEFWENTE